MRFLSLDLIRYGHFTDRSILFRPEAGLHIVYGPNEAGKSSALSAFSDLLFGFPDRDVGFDFLHEARDLRIGAEIAARSGARLSFRRRKGRKNTLLEGAAETALNDDALAAFLGSLERPVFERAFGLDSERLRAGADEMLADGGEIGQMLFSAASGLTGLRIASERLAADADAIYAPRRSQTRSFYQALDRHDEARKAERALELNASDWKALLKEEREIDEEIDTVQDRCRKRAARIAELERLQRLRGLVLEIDRHVAALAELEDVASVADETGLALETLEADRQRLQATIAEKGGRLGGLRRDLEALKVDDALLERRGDVSRLGVESGLYAQAVEALPARRLARDDAMAELAGYAAQLGLSSVEELESSSPNAMLRAELEQLVEEGGALAREKAAAEKALAEGRQALSALEGDRGEGHLVDPTPLRRRYEALRPDILSLEEMEALETEISRRERSLGASAAGLRPAIVDIFALSQAELPNQAELRRHRDAVASARKADGDSARALTELMDEEARLSTQLATEGERGPVPTRAAIVAARTRRDGLFRAFAEGASAAQSYINAVEEADRLADGALDDAERVARLGEIVKRLTQTQGSRETMALRRDEAAAALERATADYRGLFSRLAIAPAEPDEMIEWLRAVETLFVEREAVQSLRDKHGAALRRRDELLPALRALARDLGIDAELPALALCRQIGTALDRLSERWAGAREREGQRAAARQAIEARVSELAVLETRKAEFQKRYTVALGRFGLAPDTGLAAARAALALRERVPPLLASRERLSRETAADEARIARFEDDARALAETVAPEMAADAPAEIIRRLAERVEIHATRATRRETLEENAAVLQREIDALGVGQENCEARIGEIAASLPEGVSIAGLAERLKMRAGLRQELREARRRFDEGSDGADEAETRALAAGLDIAACRQELETLGSDQADDNEAFETLRERRLGCRHRKEAMGQGQSAEAAAFERVSAEAEARDLAREWVVLKLAGRLLDSALDRYREGRADPILAAAGRHFRALTRGAFDGLTQAYGEQDTLVLSALRAGGEEVPVGGLSDGTRDQLYLALRLAFLEDYASRNEPAPLIVDDIFQTFDDDRSAAGLKALSALGRIQTILFTHEASVVEIAQRELAGQADIIRLER
ncbi:ATP-binding protein [Martelella endophytica]|uniref:YhaN AAA domain-containing protein n=1 Tax=Martelella endophytica TaxID=1486262 RepID=A0A0D5LTG3_MAREN|nr:YhaN family protein [Martelella endophytica]AJY46668.1 hypothetical protein TM49_14880 [Martelella endophytica]